ncbi:MAG TPA: NUDIX hydrolase [Candidatus Limiplasma sp.]|nr:NUDIX hydrolase [Candidatus Limiplasma sp.]
MHSVTGSHIHYDVVRYKNPVVVALVKHGGNVLVEEIERYPINALSLELPAGGMEAGETPEAAAAREVLEETGITIRNAKCVYRFYSNDGGSDQLVHVVVGEYASGDIVVQTSELQDAYWMEAETLRKKITDNTMKDGVSIIAALLFL